MSTIDLIMTLVLNLVIGYLIHVFLPPIYQWYANQCPYAYSF